MHAIARYNTNEIRETEYFNGVSYHLGEAVVQWETESGVFFKHYEHAQTVVLNLDMNNVEVIKLG